MGWLAAHRSARDYRRDSGVAAGGFCAVLLAPLIEADGRKQGTALWCRRGRGLYGPGLTPFGLDPARLIIVHGPTDTGLFWVMEEALRSGALVGVLGEIDAASPTALRRLQLAAESHGTMALLLRPWRAVKQTMERSSPTATRWRVGATPGQPAADSADRGALRNVRPCWEVELLRCKSGFSVLHQQVAMADAAGHDGICIAAVNATAGGAGIVLGLSLAEARALLPCLTVADADPGGEEGRPWSD